MTSFIRAAIFVVLMLLNLSIPAFAGSNTPTKNAVMHMISQETDDRVTMHDISRIVNAVWKEATKHKLDPLLLIGLIKTESTFNPRARNKSGARGLTQVVPFWHRDKIRGRNIMNIETNIEVGTQVFADCLEQHNNNLRKATRCYSGGAKNYLAKIMTGHSKAQKADVRYRFERELPLIADSSETFSTLVSPDKLPSLPEKLLLASVSTNQSSVR